MSMPVAPLGDADPLVKPRKTIGGLTQVTGTKLGDWFYNLNTFGPEVKKNAKLLEGAIEKGDVVTSWYQAVGTGRGNNYRDSVRKFRGALQVSYREYVPFGFVVTKTGSHNFQGKVTKTGGNILVTSLDLSSANRKAAEWQGRGKLDTLWGGDVEAFKQDLFHYLRNEAQGLPGDTSIGAEKKNNINAFLVGNHATFSDANPLRPSLSGEDKQGLIRTWRLDRINTVKTTDATRGPVNYPRMAQNLTPEAEPRKQPGLEYKGYWDAPKLHLYNLTEDHPELGPKGTTITDVTLKKFGYDAPVPEHPDQQASPGNAVEYDSLPDETKGDIAAWLHENVPALRDEWSPEHVNQELADLTDPVVLNIVQLPVKRLLPKDRAVSKIAVDKYSKMPGQTAPPIVVANGKLLEGGHRVAAAVKRGDATITAIDITPLTKVDWAEFLKSGNDPNFPTKSKTTPPQQATADTAEKLPNAVDKPINVVHYTSRNLEQTDPKMFGRGQANKNDLRGDNKTYFFAEGSPMGRDEQFFGKGSSEAYGATLDGSKIYDLSEGKPDPLKWGSTINRLEADENVQKAGYDGIMVDTGKADGRKVVMMFKPVPVKSLGRPQPSDKALSFSPGEAEQRDEPHAPTFFSQLQRTVDKKVQGQSIPAAQLAAIIRNPQNGVKADEIKWSGLDDFLKGKQRVTKQEVVDFLKENEVKLEELEKDARQISSDFENAHHDTQRLDDGSMYHSWNNGDLEISTVVNYNEGNRDAEAAARDPEIAKENGGVFEVRISTEDDDGRMLGRQPTWDAAIRLAERVAERPEDFRSDAGATKYSEYQLPGGDNYKEMLLTLPQREPKNIPPVDLSKYKVVTTDTNSAGQRGIEILNEAGERIYSRSGFRGTDEQALRDFAASKEAQDKDAIVRRENYEGPHWDEKNVLAHTRFNDRVDADGKKVLFLEEIQSDLHQEGRRKGYKGSPELEAKKAEREQQIEEMNKQLFEKHEQLRHLRRVYSESLDNFYSAWSKLEQSVPPDKRVGDLTEQPGFNSKLQTFQGSGRDMKELIQTLLMDKILPSMWDTTQLEGEQKLWSSLEKAANDFSQADRNADDLLVDVKNLERSKMYLEHVSDEGVPDAPFKDTWHELVFKRMLRYAAENGYDKLGWTTGDQQNARYDLAKQVDKITVQKTLGGDYQITALKDGQQVVRQGAEDHARLAELVGQSIADKSKNIEPGSLEVFTGDDLKVGGKGMRGFYDKILPDFARKYGRKWGAELGHTYINEDGLAHLTATSNDRGGYDITDTNNRGRVVQAGFRTLGDAKRWLKDHQAAGTQVWSLPVTPEMKKSVLTEGQQLFTPNVMQKMPEQELNRVAKRVIALTAENGGTTFNVRNKSSLKGGYAVSIFPERTLILHANPNADELRAYIEKNWDLLGQPDHSLGTWRNEGKTYVDVSVTVKDPEFAKFLGREYNQKAIFDLNKFEEIPTGGTGEAVSKPVPEPARVATAKQQFTSTARP
jgi:uncharacterized coiled-coil protein SlyX